MTANLSWSTLSGVPTGVGVPAADPQASIATATSAKTPILI
jgi:hypothetical protein